jgi:DDE superfamily endonuclease
MDEHRLGLLPLLKRVWALKGQRPAAPVRRRYQWLYVYGFVRPTTGQSWWCLLPTVSQQAFSLALAAFARDEGLDATHRAVLVLDQAGGHTSPKVALPLGLDLAFLPPDSPELAPAERLWPLVDEVVITQTFPDLDALEAVLVPRCQTLTRQRSRLKSLTRYHWWPRERRPKRTQ